MLLPVVRPYPVQDEGELAAGLCVGSAHHGPAPRALMAAGLVDRVQVALFPVITGQSGMDPVFKSAADFDLELIEHRTLDGQIQELVYRPALHV